MNAEFSASIRSLSTDTDNISYFATWCPLCGELIPLEYNERKGFFPYIKIDHCIIAFKFMIF